MADETDGVAVSEVSAEPAAEIAGDIAGEPGVESGGEPEPERVPGERISSPRKVMRIGSMLKQLLDEIRTTPLDQTSREKLAEVHDASVKELCACLSPDLQDELKDLTLPFANESSESAELTDIELRIAQAQLVGWLEGLLHGIQAAMAAQTGSIKSDKDSKDGKKNSDKTADDTVGALARPGQYL